MSDLDDALKLPMIAVRVDLMLRGGTARSVELFVAEHRAREYRRQLVTDLLTAPGAFVPVRMGGASGGIELLSKAALVWVRVPQTGGEPPVEETADPSSPNVDLFDEVHSVRVDLAGAGALHGDILYSAAIAGHRRVIDYLNQPGLLLRLWTTEHLYLVNKQFVDLVVEV